jgi:hypothetical protein
MSFLWGNTANKPPDPKKFANISNDQINSNQQAVPVKYLAGRNYVAGDYISPAYNPVAKPIKTESGKDQSTTTGYKYFADFALVFCTGGRRPVDALYKVIVDSDIRWKGNVVRQSGHEKETIQVEGLGTLHLYWGSESQPIDNILLKARGTATGGTDPKDSTTWPAANAQTGEEIFSGLPSGNSNPYSGHYDIHPAYRGQCYGVFKNWKLGRDRTSVPNIQLELKRGCPWINGGGVDAEDRGINPIAVLYDWLTDTRFGMALPDSSLNTATFSSTFTQLEAIQGRISPLVTSQTDFRQIVAELMEYYDGWIRRNGQLIEVGMWQSGNINSTIHLTDDDLLAEPELEPQGWGPTINELTVVYKDREHHFNDYIQNYRDPNNFRITGGPRPETFSRPWLTDATLAKSYARTSGASLALPFTGGNLTVKREWLTTKGILPGNIFWYDSAFYELSFLVRLLAIEHQADNSAKAVMTVEWERSKWPSLFKPPPFQGPGGFVLGPRAIWQSRVSEVPFMLENQKFDTQIVTLAVRGNVEVQGYRIWISLDAGATYQKMPDDASSSSFASFGKQFSAIGTADTSIGFHLYGIDLDLVVSQTNAQWNDDNLMCFVGSEILSIGRVINYGHGFFTAYIKRGRYGTAPAAHAANGNLFFIYRANLKLIDNAGFIPGAAIKVKLQPFTVDLDYDLNLVTAINYTVVGFDDIPTPVLAPSPSTFATSVNVRVANPPAGMKIRYTHDGSEVTGTSREWPRGTTGNYTTLSITYSSTLRVRFYATSGRFSGELIAHYTKVTGTLPPQICGAPTWSFDGVLQHTGGNLTITVTTSGSVIKYQKNNGAVTNYPGTPVHLNCTATGDTIDFWAALAGMSDSPHRFIDNSLETTFGGGGHNPPRNPP